MGSESAPLSDTRLDRLTGTHPDAPTALLHPLTPSALGTVALVHGGYWRGAFTRAVMDPMADDLTSRGWTVANIEYRRVGAGGGWPLPLDDTLAACRQLIAHVEAGRLPGPVVLLGHSVGGQLALLAARELHDPRVAGVLALAPVTDVVETWRAGLGDDAARELLAASSGDPMQIANQASPRFLLPIGAVTRIVHGIDDARVPIEHSRVFADRATAAGDDVVLHALPTLEHRAAIDPRGSHWSLVAEELRRISAAP